MNEVKLKPCPFCGSKNIGIDMSAKSFEGRYNSGWMITSYGFCKDCGARGGDLNHTVQSGTKHEIDVIRQETKEYWNDRASEE